MPRKFTVLVLLLLFALGSSLSQATTFHVTKSGDDAKTGLSWGTAFATVDFALATAQPGDDIWVAAGTYITHATVRDRVSLYGGFHGFEGALSQANPATNVTTLDGDGFGFILALGGNTVQTIDGFTITHGQIGISLNESSPTISRNRIIDNTGAWNSGISVNGGSPRIVDNYVARNTGFGDGGGMLFTFSSPDIERNTITQNTGQYGGGINFYQCGSITLLKNTITGNKGKYIGGVIVNDVYVAPADIEGNTISNNQSTIAGTGGLQMSGHTRVTVSGNTISDNLGSGSDAGGFEYQGAPITFANNVVQRNHGPGGGVVIVNSSATISGNTISQNVAASTGVGGLLVVNITGTVSHNIFSGNRGGQCGGLGHFASTAAVLYNIFDGNVTDTIGGGLRLESSVTAANNVFKGNQASAGGGVYIGGDVFPRLINNTIVGNIASTEAGGVYAYIGYPTLSNNIVAFNTNGGVSGFQSGIIMDRNCVYGNTAYNYGGGVSFISNDINADPQFTSLATLRLKVTSPCFDAGIDSLVAPNWTDVTGSQRIAFQHVDLGAYEIQTPPHH